MKIVALLSGGKDSIFNLLKCQQAGHELVVVGNLFPHDPSIEELDSFCFQTVGHGLIESLCECLDVPLIRLPFTGRRTQTELTYTTPVPRISSGDASAEGEGEREEEEEVEVLFRLLSEIKKEFPSVEGVSSGAILSHYQKNRIENVCGRLGLTSIAYLWERDQGELLDEMIETGIDAILIKAASFGLEAGRHCGKTITELRPLFHELHAQYGMNICGEGGEYETLVLDCPLFLSRRVVMYVKFSIFTKFDGSDESEIEVENDGVTGHMVVTKFHLELKQES